MCNFCNCFIWVYGGVILFLKHCIFFPKQYTVWGSQCFLSVSALSGMLCPPFWACLRNFMCDLLQLFGVYGSVI